MAQHSHKRIQSAVASVERAICIDHLTAAAACSGLTGWERKRLEDLIARLELVQLWEVQGGGMSFNSWRNRYKYQLNKEARAKAISTNA